MSKVFKVLGWFFLFGSARLVWACPNCIGQSESYIQKIYSPLLALLLTPFFIAAVAVFCIVKFQKKEQSCMQTK